MDKSCETCEHYRPAAKFCRQQACFLKGGILIGCNLCAQKTSHIFQQRITELEKTVQDQADMIVKKGKRVLELEQRMAGPEAENAGSVPWKRWKNVCDEWDCMFKGELGLCLLDKPENCQLMEKADED